MVAATKSASLVREAYPKNMLLFEEQDGIYWLRGKDLARAKKLVGFCCEEQSMGLDGESAGYCIKALLEQGEKVGILKGNTVRPLVLRGSGDPSKVKSRTIGLMPELLFGRRELERLSHQLTRRSASSAELVERLQAEFASGKPTSDLGTLWVYQIGVDCYECDWELTTIPESVVEALAVAAHLAGKMLRCQLVEPNPRRKKGRAPKPTIVVSEPVVYGQLRFAF